MARSNTSPPLSNDQRLALHGEAYVAAFETDAQARRLRRLLERIKLPANAVVADFGCGSGLVLEYIGSHVRRYVGVDFSQPFIDAAEQRCHCLGLNSAQFYAESIQDFARRFPKTFDVGLALDLSEHVYNVEWLDILRCIHSSLKPDGTLYLHTPNADFFVERLKRRNLLLKQHPEHVAVRTVEENIALLESAGFTKLKVELLSHYNVLRHVHSLTRLPIVGRFLEARIFIAARK